MSTTAECTAVPSAVTTPSSIQTPMGALEFNDGYPTADRERRHRLLLRLLRPLRRATGRAGSQSFPSPAAEPEPDGSSVVYFSPTQPDGVADGNWIQTDPDRSWFVALRLYSPLQSFFDKTWRPGELEPLD